MFNSVLYDSAEALAWEERMGDFLQEPATLTEERPFPSAITAGAIGPYRLLQKIGEGGMAEVWQAEQTSPVHRTVALKFIKAGMDTKALVARFESERQALALMEHPAIARVFDAGSTAEGRPYFVMEYTPGVPITDYCDKYRLSMRERLALFVQVCEGVQHAHQKAIIHRDLKPSNVLVCMQDGKAVPKIIDFGIAKALSQMLTERTMFTELGVLVGTPEYMSPEQADLTVHNIDTRTDVYSLGLILYELLAGVLPFDAKEFRREGWGEILRRIREEEPTRPSTKVWTLGDGAAVAARNRKTEPQALERQLRGDLDWITMKALEKDRTRRYGSPSELAAEISRYLRHEPVVASPPSVVYRARKFARRHRFGVGVAAGLIVLLLGFALTMGLQAQRIARERDRANREAEVSRRVKEFLTGLFQISDPSEARGSTITAREILDKGAAQIDTALQNQPEIQAQLMQTMGLVYQKLGLYGQAASLLERAVSTQSRVLGPEHPDTLSSMGSLGGVYRRRGRGSDAEKILRRALEISQRRLGPDRLETLQAMNNLARVLAGEGPGGPHKEEAATLLKGALERARRALGADHQVTLQSAMYLAMAYSNEGRFDEAEPLFREAVAGRRRTLGPAHSDTLDAVHNLALNLIYKKH